LTKGNPVIQANQHTRSYFEARRTAGFSVKISSCPALEHRRCQPHQTTCPFRDLLWSTLLVSAGLCSVGSEGYLCGEQSQPWSQRKTSPSKWGAEVSEGSDSGRRRGRWETLLPAVKSQFEVVIGW